MHLYLIWKNSTFFFSSQWNFDGLEGILWVFLLTISWIYMHLLTGFQYGSRNSRVTKKCFQLWWVWKNFLLYDNIHEFQSICFSALFNVSLNLHAMFYMERYAFWRMLMELYGIFSSQWNFYGVWRNYMGFSLHNSMTLHAFVDRIPVRNSK